jgi:hypothetical protein
MTDQELLEIETRLNSGEQWKPSDCEMKVDVEDGYIYVEQCDTIGDTLIQLGDSYENYQDDWVFIAYAREDMRKLVEEVKRLRAERVK